MGKSIQFRGIPSVVKAYQSGGVGPWAIINGKNILSSSQDVSNEDTDTGASQLRQFLTCMAEGGSEGAYELGIYKLKDDQTDVEPDMKPYRAFCFSLFGIGEATPYSQVRGVAMQRDNDRIDRLEAMVQHLCEKVTDEEGEEDEEKGGVIGMLNNMIKIPQIQEAIGLWAGGLVRKMTGMETTQMPARVAGVEPQGESLLDAEQVGKVNRALQILASRDAKLGDHLLALASKSPEIYNMALKML